MDIKIIRKTYDKNWLVVEITKFNPKTLLPERGIVHYQTSNDDDAYQKTSELIENNLEAKTFYIFYND